jgi:dihydrofolate reductase
LSRVANPPPNFGKTVMSKVRVAAFSLSLDGFGAGPSQSLDNPLGVGGESLHQWFFPTRTFQKMVGKEGGATTGPDEEFAARSFQNLGAWILGRNMFGPIRGRTRIGKAGGAPVRRITPMFSCSPTTRESRSRWKAARRSIL